MLTPVPIYIMGDVHGQLRQLIKLLQQEQLIDHQHHWIGKQAIIWFIGDLVDRGKESIAVLDLVMNLQREAVIAGGQVGCLLGNHEMLMLAAYRFGRRSTGLSSNFITRWRRTGGQKDDLAKLTREHLQWMAQLPAMVKLGSTLLIHADATFYTRYGSSVEDVNTAFHSILSKSNALAWEELLEEFAMRGVFHHQFAGPELLQRFTTIFQCTSIVHGHTPINFMLNSHIKKITSAYVYANGQCTNVDGGLYLGGSGFLHKLTDSSLFASMNVNTPVLDIDKPQSRP